MPNPKRKMSKSRRDKRRTHYKATAPRSLLKLWRNKTNTSCLSVVWVLQWSFDVHT